MDIELKDLNRDQLNDYASEHFAEAIPDPKAYGNKGELQAAIEAAAAGETVPAPPDQKRGGTTVTFTEGPEGVRSVRVGDDRFLLNTPVHHVSDETVAVLKELEDHEFEYATS